MCATSWAPEDHDHVPPHPAEIQNPPRHCHPLIEKLWQQMKYDWMNVKSRTLDNFGTDFELAF
jgi:hypothetical protein